MTKVKVITVINERPIEAYVNSSELSSMLKMRAEAARYQGLRPGQPADLTQTASDPISHEKLATLHLMKDSLQKNGQL